MTLIISIIVTLYGSLMIFKPCWYFTFTESWKSNESREPSDEYLSKTRMEGVLFLLGGLGYIFVKFI